MICPHCAQNLRYRERGRRRCKYCRKHFAFEPKANKLFLHDVKVRTLGTKLSDGGELRYTVTQLWYAAARKQVANPRTRSSACGCMLFFIGLAVFLATIGFFTDGPGNRSTADIGIGIGIGIVGVLGYLLLMVVLAKRRREAPIRPAVPLGEFRDMILRQWVETYRALPDGLIDEQQATAPAVAAPRVALVCPDRSVLACLGANGVPGMFSMALTMSPEHVPPAVPVIIVHDASPAGCRFAARVRAALPGRVVVDAGLQPRTVLAKQNSLRLRQKPPPAGQVAGLGLTAAEATWLAQGWWSPVAAIPPARLIAGVTKAAERAGGAADPDEARAERLGFLTWPVA